MEKLESLVFFLNPFYVSSQSELAITNLGMPLGTLFTEQLGTEQSQQGETKGGYILAR